MGAKMKSSIVRQLDQWLSAHLVDLVSNGIEVVDRLPQPPSTVPWKASIGLCKNGILVSYTVWERSTFQTELIIVDGRSGATLQSEDGTPVDPEEIERVLNDVVGKIISGQYRST